MELTLKERRKLTRVTAGRYRKAAKREKTAILDTFIVIFHGIAFALAVSTSSYFLHHHQSLQYQGSRGKNQALFPEFPLNAPVASGRWLGIAICLGTCADE